MTKSSRLTQFAGSALLLSYLNGCAATPKPIEVEPEMKISHIVTLSILVVPVVMAACEHNRPPVYDGSLEAEDVLLGDTEASVYGIIEVTPEEWAAMSPATREAIYDHNVVFQCRNPEAAAPGFDTSLCETD